jgi:mercuric ion binding protein
MRRIITILLTTLPLAALAATPKAVTLDVAKMTCETCPIVVKKALEKVPGVSEVKMDFAKKTATVQFDPDRASAAALVKATTDAGFPSTVHK